MLTEKGVSSLQGTFHVLILFGDSQWTLQNFPKTVFKERKNVLNSFLSKYFQILFDYNI